MTYWAAGGSVVGGALAGGLLGGGGTENIGPGDMIPKWARQDWQRTGRNIRNLQDPTSYGGPWSAGLNPMLNQSWMGGMAFGQPGGAGANAANISGLAGAGMLGYGTGQGMDYMNQLRSQGPQQFKYDQGTFNQVMGNLTPGLQGAYDAAMRDPIRQYSEQTIPGINQGAVASGQGFGTRPQNQSAIAARGLADRGADTASGLWMNAANQANQAGYGAGGMNLQSGQALQQNLLGGYSNMANQGGQLLNQGYNMGAQNLQMQNTIGGQRQAYEQQLFDRQREQWNEQQNLPWTAQQNRQNLYAGLSGGTNQGGTNTGFSNAVNGAQLGLGLYNMFSPMFGGGSTGGNANSGFTPGYYPPQRIG